MAKARAKNLLCLVTILSLPFLRFSGQYRLRSCRVDASACSIDSLTFAGVTAEVADAMMHNRYHTPVTVQQTPPLVATTPAFAHLCKKHSSRSARLNNPLETQQPPYRTELTICVFVRPCSISMNLPLTSWYPFEYPRYGVRDRLGFSCTKYILRRFGIAGSRSIEESP